MKIFNLGRFFMPKNPLLDELETPEGEMKTNAFLEIESLLSQKAEDLRDYCPPDAQMYYAVKSKLIELMEVME